MNKNDCKYIVEKVFEITPEVIELIEKYYFETHFKKLHAQEIIKFISANNLKLTKDNIIRAMIIPNSTRILAIKGLIEIKSFFEAFTDVKIIRTPKCKVLVSNETMYHFEDDLLQMFEITSTLWNNYRIEYIYKDDICVYKKINAHGYIFSYYYSTGLKVLREFKTTQHYIKTSIEMTEKVGSITLKSSYLNFDHFVQTKYNSSGEIIENSYRTYDVQYFPENNTKVVKIKNNNVLIETTQYFYDHLGNIIRVVVDYGKSKYENDYRYHYKDRSLYCVQHGKVSIFEMDYYE